MNRFCATIQLLESCSKILGHLLSLLRQPFIIVQKMYLNRCYVLLNSQNIFFPLHTWKKTWKNALPTNWFFYEKKNNILSLCEIAASRDLFLINCAIFFETLMKNLFLISSVNVLPRKKCVLTFFFVKLTSSMAGHLIRDRLT